MRHLLEAAARFVAVGALVALAGLTTGCDKKLNLVPVVNQPPIVELVAAPIDTNAVCTPDAARSCYSITLNWSGHDPDGRVDHYEYVIDPPDVGDTTWVITTENERRITFDRPTPSRSPKADSLQILRGFHTFVIAAVNNQRLRGPRVFRSFFSFTKAPTVNISAPRPLSDERLMPPSIRITWRGVDDDGVFTNKPVRYKYLLVGPGNSDVLGGASGIDDTVNDPGRLRQLFAPDFPAIDNQGRPLWKTVGGETTSVQFTNLLPDAHYLFIVVAFDEAGAYTPTFTLDSNILRFKVGLAAGRGPAITVFNEFIFFLFPKTFNVGDQFALKIETPANQLVTFNWFAVPSAGADIRGFRWMLDGDVFDETDRSDENTDLRHWSSSSASTVSATIGPFSGGVHNFYLEAEDNTGFRSLATIQFTVVAPTFARPLLFVDDTRLAPDTFLANGDYNGPTFGWPAAAEIDTFLHAVGGKPWKFYPGWPDNPTLSPEGILHGYSYDTLGTRVGVLNAGVPLLKLGGYQHVVWAVDFKGAGFTTDGISPTTPITALRYSSTPGRLNTLAAYLRQGGEAWLCGSGGGLATTLPFNGPGNDQGGVLRFANYQVFTTARELAPGRFMWDITKWQSEFRGPPAVASGSIVRAVGRYRSDPRPGQEFSPPLPGHPYGALPPVLQLRDPGSDPVPPLRQSNNYYNSGFPAEVLTGDNEYRETVVGDPNELRMDDFDDTEAGIRLRWKVSDSLNIVVTQVVVPPGSPQALNKAMQIGTQGGGASDGDRVTLTFGSPRDYSGLRQLKLGIRQDQPTSSVQWLIRLIDQDQRSMSALINTAVTGSFQADTILPNDFVEEFPQPTRLTQVRKVELQLVRGTVAAFTAFDRIEIASLPEVSALDTLMVVTGGGGFPVRPGGVPTMTYYRGKDLIKPFLFSGFEVWGFRRQQCKALFDFVFHNLWGLDRSTDPNFPGPSPANITTGRVVSTPSVRATPAPRPSVSRSGGAPRGAQRRGRGAQSRAPASGE